MYVLIALWRVLYWRNECGLLGKWRVLRGLHSSDAAGPEKL